MSPTTPLYLTLSDLERSKARSIAFSGLLSGKGAGTKLYIRVCAAYGCVYG